MQALDGLSTIRLNLIIDDNVSRINAIDGHMDYCAHVVTVVPTGANTIHHLCITHTYRLVANAGTDAFAGNLFNIADLTTVGSLIGEGIAKSSTYGVCSEMLDMSSQM